ncbi:hypothetical protein [Mesorhizobium sp. Mes31]|uniref:hypothetical protein n=1 Tax=Mesorhizobium sp. Mes31 TaxID=2926017 RepID=UPI0021181384|nr:hypothetical protein [Mesorhizobium sp. Mes31]
MLLKSHLLGVATDDRWNRRHIGHDLDKAALYAERAGLGLPPRLHSVIVQLHTHFQRGGFQRDPSRSWPSGFSLDARHIARQLAQTLLERGGNNARCSRFEDDRTPRSIALILGSADGLTPSTRKGSDYAKRAAAPASPSR